MTKDESYWIVRVTGVEQGWSRTDPKVLEEPKPFVGYISSVDWAFQASAERQWAHRFKDYPPVIKPEWVGPWYYKISKVEVIRVQRTVEEIEVIE